MQGNNGNGQELISVHDKKCVLGVKRLCSHIAKRVLRGREIRIIRQCAHVICRINKALQKGAADPLPPLILRHIQIPDAANIIGQGSHNYPRRLSIQKIADTKVGLIRGNLFYARKKGTEISGVLPAYSGKCMHDHSTSSSSIPGKSFLVRFSPLFLLHTRSTG